MNQPRKPKGTPTGGQFAEKAHAEASDGLAETSSSGPDIDEMHDEFRKLRLRLRDAHLVRFAGSVRKTHPEAQHVAIYLGEPSPWDEPTPRIEFVADADGSLLDPPEGLEDAQAHYLELDPHGDLGEASHLEDPHGSDIWGTVVVDLDDPAGVQNTDSLRFKGTPSPFPSGSPADGAYKKL